MIRGDGPELPDFGAVSSHRRTAGVTATSRRRCSGGPSRRATVKERPWRQIRRPPPAPIPTVTTIKEVIDALQSIIDWSISVSSRLCYFPALHVQAAVVVTPVIWFQTVKRSAISCRHPVADSRCRRGRKCGEMRLNADLGDLTRPGESGDCLR